MRHRVVPFAVDQTVFRSHDAEERRLTRVQHDLPVKVVLLKNNSLAEVRFEQEELKYPQFGCDLPPIDFVAFAKACGAFSLR